MPVDVRTIRILALVLVVVCTTATSFSSVKIVTAASIPVSADPIASTAAAPNLLQLCHDTKVGNAISVDQVLKAYEEYVDLFQTRDYLASNSTNGDASSGQVAKYESISGILDSAGLDVVVETLFAPFNGDPPPLLSNGQLAGEMQRRLSKAINRYQKQNHGRMS